MKIIDVGYNGNPEKYDAIDDYGNDFLDHIYAGGEFSLWVEFDNPVDDAWLKYMGLHMKPMDTHHESANADMIIVGPAKLGQMPDLGKFITTAMSCANRDLVARDLKNALEATRKELLAADEDDDGGENDKPAAKK